MDKLQEQKELIALEKKLGPSFASEIRGSNVKDLEFKLLQLAKHKEDVVTTMKRDDELLDAKELVKELNEPYRDQLKANGLKSRFVALLLKEKQENV